MKNLLNKVYGFDIPESVIRTVLKNKFTNELIRRDGYYHFNEKIKGGFSKTKEEFEQIDSEQKIIFDDLFLYISKKIKTGIEEKDRKEILDTFTRFLLDNGYSDKYSNWISAFIISKEKDSQFKHKLNSIKEGLILYQGINYTADLNQLGSWKTDLTIYLGTEHLFNALGYNGILYQEIFDDFYKLVSEINQSYRSKGGGNSRRDKIELKYFEEIKEEIDNFFLAAESILKGHKTFDPSKFAMETILKDCKTPSDIKAKRTKFDIQLNQKRITLHEFNYSIEEISKYNVEDLNILEGLRNKAKASNRYFDEYLCSQYFKIFTKINTLRRGASNTAFEKIGHLYVTETSLAKYLAHNYFVKFENNDIPFAKDIDFLTTRFWFTLKKGFSNKPSLPKSFDIVTKAKIILSSHINSSISNTYEKLVKEKSAGRLSDEEALARSYSLREKPNAPEEITIENLDSSIDFLHNANHLEDFYREKVKNEQLLEITQRENQDLLNSLNTYRQKEEEEMLREEKELIENQKNAYVLEKWDEWKSGNNKDLKFLIALTIFNLILIIAIFLIAVSTKAKEWIIKLEAPQLILITLYVLFVLVEALGSKYLFDKEKLKNGFRWLLDLFKIDKIRETKYVEFEEQFKANSSTTKKSEANLE